MKPNVVIDFSSGRRYTPQVGGRILAALDNLVLFRGDMSGLTVKASYRDSDGRTVSGQFTVTLFDGDQSGHTTMETADGLTHLASESGHVEILLLDSGGNVPIVQATVPLTR